MNWLPLSSRIPISCKTLTTRSLPRKNQRILWGPQPMAFQPWPYYPTIPRDFAVHLRYLCTSVVRASGESLFLFFEGARTLLRLIHTRPHGKVPNGDQTWCNCKYRRASWEITSSTSTIEPWRVVAQDKYRMQPSCVTDQPRLATASK